MVTSGPVVYTETQHAVALRAHAHTHTHTQWFGRKQWRAWYLGREGGWRIGSWTLRDCPWNCLWEIVLIQCSQAPNGTGSKNYFWTYSRVNRCINPTTHAHTHTSQICLPCWICSNLAKPTPSLRASFWLWPWLPWGTSKWSLWTGPKPDNLGPPYPSTSN
jgi:hypothetical protein